MLLSSYRGMQKWQEKLAPLQDKIFKYMQREIEDIDETDKWKVDEDDEDAHDDNNI